MVPTLRSDYIPFIISFVEHALNAYYMLAVVLDTQGTKEECDMIPDPKVS